MLVLVGRTYLGRCYNIDEDDDDEDAQTTSRPDDEV